MAVRFSVFAAFLLFFLLFFRLKTVIVSGSVHLKPDEVTRILLERPSAENTLLTKLFNTNRTLNREGFVERIDTQILGRDKLRVIVEERKFVGCVEAGGAYWYFDSSGRVYAKAPQRTKGEPIPLVEGLELRADPEVMFQLPVANTKAFSMLAMLRNFVDSDPGMLPDSAVFEGSAMTLRYGKIDVLTGSGEKLEMRLRELSGVLPELKSGYQGTLHLENYDGSQNGLIFDRK